MFTTTSTTQFVQTGEYVTRVMETIEEGAAVTVYTSPRLQHLTLQWEEGSHYIHIVDAFGPVDIATNLYDYEKGEARVPTAADFEEAVEGVVESYLDY